MRPISARWKLPPISKYERLALGASLLAMLISLFAAVVSPIATYYWFDPQTKENKERGFLLVVDSAVADIGYSGSPVLGAHQATPQLKPEFESTFDLLNAGKRPIKELQLFVGLPPGATRQTSVSATGRVTELTKSDPRHAIFSVGGALAPGETVQIHFHGPQDSGLVVRTEHGDTTVLHAADESKWKHVDKTLPPSTRKR